MKDGVQTVNSTSTPNSCTLEDIEVCVKEVQEISTVTEDGEIDEHKETYLGESYIAYYACDGCGKIFHAKQHDSDYNTTYGDGTWDAVKEHLDV